MGYVRIGSGEFSSGAIVLEPVRKNEKLCKTSVDHGSYLKKVNGGVSHLKTNLNIKKLNVYLNKKTDFILSIMPETNICRNGFLRGC